MKTCPLCKSRVTYVGFASIECVGKGCQNYKAPPLKTIEDWKAEFDDTPIEYYWFMYFCKWLEAKTGHPAKPYWLAEVSCYIYTTTPETQPQPLWLTWRMPTTRKQMRKDLEIAEFPGRRKNPFAGVWSE